MNPTILVVEDSPTQALQTRLDLEAQGFEVLLAADGREALEIARRERPDAILSDILMPDMDGFQLTMAVRADPELATTPLILNTATYRDDEDRTFALSTGADAYIEKEDLAPEILAALLQEVIDRGRERRGPPGEPADLEDNILLEDPSLRPLDRLGTSQAQDVAPGRLWQATLRQDIGDWRLEIGDEESTSTVVGRGGRRPFHD